MLELYELSKKYPELGNIASFLLGVPEETKKGGASQDLSSNGIWSFNDFNSTTKEMGQKKVEKMVEAAVKFIEAWKLAKSQICYFEGITKSITRRNLRRTEL